jgi:hypothetical protein
MPNGQFEAGAAMTHHTCPVCGKEHAVTAARQSVAWGRRLTCSCTCEVERRRRVRKRLLDPHALRVQHEVH